MMKRVTVPNNSALDWSKVKVRSQVYGESRLGRLVWLYLRWIEPGSKAQSRPDHGEPIAGYEQLRKMHLAFAVDLAAEAVTRRKPLTSDQSVYKDARRLLDDSSQSIMRTVIARDAEMLLSAGRFVRNLESAEKSIVLQTFGRSLRYELARRVSRATDGDGVAATADRSRLEALLRPQARSLANFLNSIPPFPLVKNFVTSAYPFWDALPLRWTNSNEPATVECGIDDGTTVTIRLDGIVE